MIHYSTTKMNTAAVEAFKEHCKEEIDRLETELDKFFGHCIYTPQQIIQITDLLSEYFAYTGKEYIKKIKENTIV